MGVVARALCGVTITLALAACSLTALDGLSDGTPTPRDPEKPTSTEDSGSITLEDAGDASTSYAGGLLADHPLGYWRLGETSVGEAADQTKRNPGVMAGGIAGGEPGAIAGDPNTAMRFDGVTSQISVPGNAFDFARRSPFSIEAWIYPTKIDSTYRRIASNERRTGSQRQGWTFWVVEDGSDGVLGFERYRDGTADGVGTNGIIVGRWVHAVVTYDGATLLLFVDGALASSATSKTWELLGSSNMFLATDPENNRWTGSLDEIAIYDYALTPTTIKAHYAAAGR